MQIRFIQISRGSIFKKFQFLWNRNDKLYNPDIVNATALHCTVKKPEILIYLRTLLSVFD